MRRPIKATNTWSWGGQLTTSSSGGYSTGYIKYASNGSDKNYFYEHRDPSSAICKSNLWAGYVSDGKSYDLLGNLIDSNLFNNEDTAGAGAVPDINKFTSVRFARWHILAASPNANAAANGVGLHRIWTVDLALDNDQFVGPQSR